MNATTNDTTDTTTNDNDANGTATAPQASATAPATDTGVTATDASKAATEAARAPVVIVIDKMHKTDAFFFNLKALCGMVSKDETRRVIMRVCIETCEMNTGRLSPDADGLFTVPIMETGSRFVATDGRRLAILETERVFAPGLYEIKQATGKTITLFEDKYAGVYANWQQVFPSEDGMFKTNRNGPASILYACSRLGVILNPDYVFCLPDGDYDVFIGDIRSPVLFKSEGFKVLLMPLRIDGDGRGHTELDKEVARRVVADLAEREALVEKFDSKARAVA